MTVEQQLVAALILCGGAFIQGTAGFGLGLFTIPLLVWNGWTLPQAVGATVPAVLGQSLLNCWQHRVDLPWRETLSMAAVRIVALPVGIYCLSILSSLDLAQIKQVIGLVLVAALLVQSLTRLPAPQTAIRWRWLLLAGATSGLMAGTIGMGGPPLSLWVMAHDWPPVRQRAFLWLSFLMLMPFQTSLLIGQFGRPLVDAMFLSLLATPATLAGALLGSRVGGRLDHYRLRLVMLGLLWLIALRSLAAPYL